MYKSRYKRSSTRSKKRKQAKSLLVLFAALSVPVLLIIGSVLLLRADFLQIKSFEISGLQAVDQGEVREAAQDFISGERLWLVPNSNILLFDKERFAAVLLSKFNRLEEALVEKKFIDKSIQVGLKERQGEFLWCLPAQADSAEECFLMTASGLIFEKIDLSRLAEISQDKIRFMGMLEGNPLLKNFSPAERMKNYESLLEAAKNGGLVISSIRVESEERAVAKSDQGEIIFDPRGENLPIVVENVILLINEIRSKDPGASFEYLDARFGNKIFYKLR